MTLPRTDRWKMCEFCGVSFYCKRDGRDFEDTRFCSRACSDKRSGIGWTLGPDLKVCRLCRRALPLACFGASGGRRVDGSPIPHARCKNCRTATVAANHRAIRRGVIAHYSNGTMSCACCGESTYEFLAIDHINNDGKEHRKTVRIQQLPRWLKRNGYPPGFQILCHNCNSAKGYWGACAHATFRVVGGLDLLAEVCV